MGQDSTAKPLTVAHMSLQGWLVCLVASLFFFFEFVQMMMFNALMPSLMHDLAVNSVVTGYISSAYFIGTSLFILPAGLLLDRFSTKRLIIGAMTLCIIGTLLFSLVSQAWLLIVSRFLTGVGGAFPLLCCLRLSSRWFPPKRWALISGVMVTMGFLGGAMGQIVMEDLIYVVGWRYALQVDAVLGVVFLLLITMVVHDRPAGLYVPQVATTIRQFGSQLWQVLRNYQNWGFGGYTALINLPVMILAAEWGQMYLHQVFGLGDRQAVWVSSMILFGTIVGSPTLGWLSDYWRRRRSPMFCFALLTLVLFVAIMATHTWSFEALLVLFFLLGVTTSAQVIAYPAVSESNPPHLTGSALGIASLIIMFMPVVAQNLFGWLIQWGWQPVYSGGIPQYSTQDYHRAMLILPISCIIGIVLIALARETYCRVRTDSQGDQNDAISSQDT